MTIDGAIAAGVDRWEGAHDGQRVVFGPGCSDRLGEEARAAGGVSRIAPGNK